MAILVIHKKNVLVDDDFNWIKKYKWHFSMAGYLRRQTKRGKFIYLHKLVNKTPNGSLTDHIDRNKLNNQKSNLRSVNSIINNINRGIFKNNKSGIKGVSWEKDMKKWRSQITFNKKQMFLGLFTKLDEAIRIRKLAELTYFN